MNAAKKWIDNNLKGDPIIWGIVILLGILSILAVYSATGTLAYRHRNIGGSTEIYLLKHSALVLASLVVMWMSHKIPYKYLAKLSLIGLWMVVPLLIFTYFYGTSVNQASRWVTIPIIGQAFQPSDIAKVALIAAVAGMLAKRQQSIRDFQRTFIPIMVWIGLICLLIALANMSTAVLLLATCLLLMFIGRVPAKFLMMVCLVGVLALTAAVFLGQRGGTFVSRIENFVAEDVMSYQEKHAYIAIATGGVAGKGPGNSDQKNFLPHPHSDFIYAIIVEEYGLIGGASVLFLYLALLYRGMRVVAISTRPFGGLLSAGLSFALVTQAMVNMAVTVGLGPITGLPLPMISMGGTSLVFTGFSIGMILSVSREDHKDSTSVELKNHKGTVKVT